MVSLKQIADSEIFHQRSTLQGLLTNDTPELMVDAAETNRTRYTATIENRSRCTCDKIEAAPS